MIFFNIVLWTLLSFKSGIATTFSAENDKWNPNPLYYCNNKKMNDKKDVTVAHPTLPCFSKVMIYNPRTQRTVVATVMDRGPRRAALDLSPKTARAIRSNGFEFVWFWPVK